MKSEAEDAIDRFVALWRRSRPGIDTRHLQTIGRILRLSEHLHDEVSKWLRPFDVSWELLDLLLALHRSNLKEGLRPTELSEECLLSSGAMANRLKMAERKKMIERRVDLADGRVSRVQLTAHGKRVAERAMTEHFAMSREVANRLSSKEHDELARLLRKLLVSFESDARERKTAKQKG